MSEEFASRLAAIDAALLEPLVLKILGRPAVQLLNWGYESLNGGFGRYFGVYGVYRFRGTARAGADILPWSLVLKAQGHTSAPESSSDPAAWTYWKREVLVYQSGLLGDLPAGLDAPRCLAVSEQPAEEAWLWLEDIEEQVGRTWPLEQFGVAAHDLGRFNGAYLAGRDLPSHQWLTQRGQWRYILSLAEPYFTELRSWCQHPSAERIMPETNIQGMEEIWEKRSILLEALADLPQCFCHGDAMRRNLFARRSTDGQFRTVAVDWAFAGIGAIGQDAAKLLMVSLALLDVSMGQAHALKAAILAAYFAGLQAAGWQGDPRRARLGYTIAAAFMGLELAARDLAGINSNVPDELVEELFGHSVDKVLAGHKELIRFTIELAREAQTLIREIGK